MGERQHVHQPRNPDAVREWERVRARGRGGHPLVDQIVPAWAHLVSDRERQDRQCARAERRDRDCRGAFARGQSRHGSEECSGTEAGRGAHDPGAPRGRRKPERRSGRALDPGLDEGLARRHRRAHIVVPTPALAPRRRAGGRVRPRAYPIAPIALTRRRLQLRDQRWTIRHSIRYHAPRGRV